MSVSTQSNPPVVTTPSGNSSNTEKVKASAKSNKPWVLPAIGVLSVALIGCFGYTASLNNELSELKSAVQEQQGTTAGTDQAAAAPEQSGSADNDYKEIIAQYGKTVLGQNKKIDDLEKVVNQARTRSILFEQSFKDLAANEGLKDTYSIDYSIIDWPSMFKQNPELYEFQVIDPYGREIEPPDDY